MIKVNPKRIKSTILGLGELRKELSIVTLNIYQMKGIISSSNVLEHDDIRLIRKFQEKFDLVIDGYFGPKSALKLELVLAEMFKSTDVINQYTSEPKALAEPIWFINFNKINPVFLSSQDERQAMYTRLGIPSKKGSNCISVEPAYPMVASWNTNIKIIKLTVHKLVAPYLDKALKEVREKFTDDEINTLRINRYGGGFSYRKIRGGNKLSTHAYGGAIDIDSIGNPMGAKPCNTNFGKHPELALRFFSIMLKHGFKTLEHDLMHLEHTGKPFNDYVK